jgi:hypothetical protein
MKIAIEAVNFIRCSFRKWEDYSLDIILALGWNVSNYLRLYLRNPFSLNLVAIIRVIGLVSSLIHCLRITGEVTYFENIAKLRPGKPSFTILGDVDMWFANSSDINYSLRLLKVEVDLSKFGCIRTLESV